MWFEIKNSDTLNFFKEKYPDKKLPKYNIDESVYIKKDFIEINSEYVNYHYKSMKSEHEIIKDELNKTQKIRQILYNTNDNLIYYKFYDINLYLGEPCLTNIINNYMKPKILIYEHIKNFNNFNK